MSDTDTKAPSEKTLHLSTPKLSLKRPAEQNTVRQSFSHGRSKAVVVETVKRRAGPAAAPKDGAAAATAKATAPAAPRLTLPAGGAPAAAPPSAAPAPRPTGMVLRTLSDSERDARASALADARVREEEERRRAEEETKRRAEREARDARERAAAEARKRDEDERRQKEDERKRRAEDEARRRLGEEPLPPRGPIGARRTPGDARRPMSLNHMGRPAPMPETTAPTTARPAAPGMRAPGRPVEAEDEAETKRVIRRPGMPTRIITPPKTPRAPGGDRNRGRLTIATATGGEDERTRSLASFRRRVQRLTGHRNAEPKEKLSREVVVPETITIQELANRMSERAVDVIRLLMKQGQLLKITDAIDADTAQLVAEELGHTVKRVAESDVEEGLFDTADTDEHLVSRPPVVTIMGHVDHGKTSLLDAIRKTNVVSGEAGGITQHIGAYQVTSPLGGKITFIDTPGHAAFTAMRARGAKVTDIVVLVVAADDGVMPQTIEAIAHARAARVPLIVAINKIDKPDANPQRVRTELLSHEIVVESMGGDTLEFEVSAKTGDGLETLLEGLQLQAEILDLRTNPERSAEGTVIEAKLDRGRGPVATVLVQRGTLRVGDIAVAGAEWGRVRALIDDKGAMVKEAGPSAPVEVLGFNGTPEAGDRVAVVESEARAREVTDYRTRQKRERSAARTSGARGSLADMMRDLKTGSGAKELPLVIKADVQGSLEAIVGALEKLGNEEVSARVIHSGVGGITESDITLAGASGAAVIGFNVRVHKEAREAAEQSGIEIRYYNIIYNLVDDVKAAMSGMLAPTLREERLGEAQVLEVFNV